MPFVIPYVDQTWADGSGGGTPVSAARLNVIEAGVKAAHYMPAVRVTHNAAQTITTATVTALAFNTERFDTASNTADTMHDTVTTNSRLTCRYAGIYSISGHAEWSANPVTAEIRIRLNGATVIAMQNLTADWRIMAIETKYALAVNDYVELMVQQSSGTNKNINNTGNYSPEFMMSRVG